MYIVVQLGVIEGSGMKCYGVDVSSRVGRYNSGQCPIRRVVGGGRQKTLGVTLIYVKITSSGVNCALNNLRGGKSRSRKGY